MGKVGMGFGLSFEETDLTDKHEFENHNFISGY